MRPLHVVLSVPRPPAEVMARLLEGVTAEYGVSLANISGRHFEVRNTRVRVRGFVRTTEAGSVVVARYAGLDGDGVGWKIGLLGLYGASHLARAGGSWFSLVIGSVVATVTLLLIVSVGGRWISRYNERHAQFAEIATVLTRVVAPLQVSPGTDSPYRSDVAALTTGPEPEKE